MAKSIKISDENYKKINERAKRERRNRKTILDMALEEYFEKKR